MAWSKYQNEIFEYALNPNNGSFVVSAVAGSGKTTTIIECAKRLAAEYPDKKILFLAFNKSIVEHLKNTIGEIPNMVCKTCHSFGYSVLMKSRLKFDLNESKWLKFYKANADSFVTEKLTDDKQYIYQRNVMDLFNICRVALVKSSDLEAIKEYSDKYAIQLISNEIETVAKMLKKSTSLIGFKNKNGKYEIDYTDMLTLAVSEAFRQHIYKYDIVFIDEAQDLSAAQQMLMKLAVKSNGKFIAVGDPYQAINGFAGAMTDSFYKLAELADDKRLPLSVNYRCGTNIIDEARKITTDIIAFENAIPGEVKHVDNLKSVSNGDMILCRNNAPLISIAIRLISIGKSAYVKGKDIANTLKSIIEKMTKDDNMIGLSSFYNKLDNSIELLRDKFTEAGITHIEKYPQFAAYVENVEMIKVLGSNVNSVSEILELIDKLFSDIANDSAIICSSIHRAKGLEADNVYIVAPEIIAKQADNMLEWIYEQEVNLKYVAITRAKKTLNFVNSTYKELLDIDFVKTLV